MPKNGKKKGKKDPKGDRALGPSPAACLRLAHNRGSEGVSPFRLATLVYPLAFTSSSVTGNTWYWQFRANSLFDPDFTGTGSQPTTFDQWMTLYDRYRVLAMEADVTLSGDSGMTDLVCAAAPGVDAAPTLTYTGIAGDRGAVLGKPAPGWGALKRIRQTILMKDVFGIDQEALMSEVNYSGTSSSSAPAVAYWNIGCFTSAATGTIMLSGELRFAVRFENPHDNNISLAGSSRTVPGSTVTSVPKPIPLTLAEARMLEAYRAAAPPQQ